MSEVAFDSSSGVYSFECPHCRLLVEVGKGEINCTIFRHGYFFAKTPDGRVVLLSQMNPHAPKEECDRLFAEGKIYGCGKPFRMVSRGGSWFVESCGYI